MKVHLIKTPEYDIKAYGEVCQFLKTFSGPMKFISTTFEFDRKEFYFLLYDLYPKHPFIYDDNDTVVRFDQEREKPLSWKELFVLCKAYRKKFKIDEDSFVVLLTQRKNALNWFSAFESKDIFVHTAEWEYFTKADALYPIAYEIVVNILQSMMKLDYTIIPNDYIHEPLKGCMNDFCENKSQIIIKLQTGNICKDCMDKIKAENIHADILKQVKSIFNGIRNEYIFKMEDAPSEPMPIVVEESSKMYFPEQNIEIKLTPLYKTLNIFYLKHLEGVRLNELYIYKDELMYIYKKVNVIDRETVAMQKSIDALVDPLGGSFSQKKSKVNKTLTQLLGESIADSYIIQGKRGEPFKIKLSKSLIDIRM